MSVITLKLSPKELELLTTLASDQLFRREFIDTRMPGFKGSPGDLGLGKKLVERMRLLTDRAKKTAPAKRNGVAV